LITQLVYRICVDSIELNRQYVHSQSTYFYIEGSFLVSYIFIYYNLRCSSVPGKHWHMKRHHSTRLFFTHQPPKPQKETIPNRSTIQDKIHFRKTNSYSWNGATSFLYPFSISFFYILFLHPFSIIL
jgi:hypothetical protein